MREEVEKSLRELKRALANFIGKSNVFFSKGYLNSDGKKALVRLIKMAAKASPELKVKLVRAYKKGDEVTVLRTVMSMMEELNWGD